MQIRTKTLHEAAAEGDLNIVRLHVYNKADVNETKLVTRKGVEIDEKESDNDSNFTQKLTPLQLAAYNSQTAIVEYLVKNGASINLAIGWSKNTALQMALAGRAICTAIRLEELGATDKEGLLKKELERRDIKRELVWAAIIDQPSIAVELQRNGLLTSELIDQVLRVATDHKAFKLIKFLLTQAKAVMVDDDFVVVNENFSSNQTDASSKCFVM